MRRLLVFNPEHDLALAANRTPYTPPKGVMILRKEKSLLPAIYADNGDFILVLSHFNYNEIESAIFYDKIIQKNLTVLLPEEIHSVKDKITTVIPWGWDKEIVRILAEAGIHHNLYPESSELEKIRDLSHRRTGIHLRDKIYSKLNSKDFYAPKELYSINDITDFIKDYGSSFFKAPWSSSGRGIVSSEHISLQGLQEWCSGIIKKQGSIMAEPAWSKVLDFATEWVIEDMKAIFKGYSVFESSSRGKYHGNMKSPQSKLLSIIKSYAKNEIDEYLEAQKEALESVIAPFYKGPLGIDMLVDNKGEINPCVEINLRLTMGFINTPDGKNWLQNYGK